MRRAMRLHDHAGRAADSAVPGAERQSRGSHGLCRPLHSAALRGSAGAPSLTLRVLPGPGFLSLSGKTAGSQFALTSGGDSPLAEKTAGGMVLGIADNLDAPAVAEHFIAFGHGLAGVVGALGLNVGAKFADERTDVRLIEDDDRIHISHSSDDLGAFVRRHQRPSLAFELAYAGIGVHRHHQSSA